MATNACIAFCSYVFILFFSLDLHSKCDPLEPWHQWSFLVTLSTYSVIYSEKYTVFWWQILITYFKCSWVSFSPSSYSEKLRWVRGWLHRWIHLTISHHSAKFRGYNAISEEEILWWFPLIISYYPSNFGGHRFYRREDITFLICHMISRDYMIRAWVTL